MSAAWVCDECEFVSSEPLALVTVPDVCECGLGGEHCVCDENGYSVGFCGWECLVSWAMSRVMEMDE